MQQVEFGLMRFPDPGALQLVLDIHDEVGGIDDVQRLQGQGDFIVRVLLDDPGLLELLTSRPMILSEVTTYEVPPPPPSSAPHPSYTSKEDQTFPRLSVNGTGG